MRKTFKYKLFPTNGQKTKLNKTLEGCRRVYNIILAFRKDAWEQEKKSISRFDTTKLLPKLKTDDTKLSEIYSQVLQEVCTRIDLAYRAFFRRVKAGEKPGHPRFKGKNRYNSFTFTQTGFELNNGLLHLSKIGNVKIKIHRPIEGQIKTLTIRKDRLDNWYACFSSITEPKPLPISDKVIGIDLGLTKFAVLSDGNVIERQKWFDKDAKSLAKAQRKLSEIEKDSPKKYKPIRILNHIHQRIANRRKDFAHKESKKIVNTYQFIAIENLSINKMQQNNFRTMNRNIVDVAWNQFVQFTTYKAVEAGRGIVQVNPKNTTQICSGCGTFVAKDLSVRIHSCPNCNLVLDRDLNAAKNILARGLASMGKIPRSSFL